MAIISKIISWFKLIYFTQAYSHEYNLETNLSSDILLKKIKEVFEGSYISPNFSIDISENCIAVKHEMPLGYRTVPFFNIVNQPVLLKVKKVNDSQQIKVEAKELVGSLSKSLLTFLQSFYFLFVWLLLGIILYVGLVMQHYDMLLALVLVPLIILYSYWFYSQRIANIEFYSSKLLKTITYLEEEKSLAIVRGIWS